MNFAAASQCYGHCKFHCEPYTCLQAGCCTAKPYTRQSTLCYEGPFCAATCLDLSSLCGERTRRLCCCLWLCVSYRCQVHQTAAGKTKTVCNLIWYMAVADAGRTTCRQSAAQSTISMSETAHMVSLKQSSPSRDGTMIYTLLNMHCRCVPRAFADARLDTSPNIVTLACFAACAGTCGCKHIHI